MDNIANILSGWFAYLLMNLPSGGALLTLLLLGLLLYAAYRVINRDSNSLQWEDLVSSKAADGVQRADWNKIGMGCGVVLSMVIPFTYAHRDGVDASGLAIIMGVSLTYLGGVSAYAATLRSKTDRGGTPNV
jgi:hypothetical protein